MADEISVSGSITALNASSMSSAVSRSVADATFSMASSAYVQGSIALTTTPTQIPLGSVTQPHWSFFENMDTTNSVYIRNGSSGADVLEFAPGESTPGGVPLRSTSVPYAYTSAGTATLDYLILSL